MGIGRWGAMVAAALVVAAVAASGAGTGSAVAAPVPSGDPLVHLDAILARSPAPEYRRFGSPGMAASADYAAGVLSSTGYELLRHDAPGEAFRVDYSPGHEPSLVRTEDGRSFPAESAFRIDGTGPAGVTCTVRRVEEVGPGDCGFVPFAQVSPEWNNLLADPAGPVDTVIARGGVGVVLQGDVAHGATIAHQIRRPIPIVSAVASERDLIGRQVRLRAMGGTVPATLRNVVALRPPADPARGYVLLQGHLDGWFEAAADNGAGAAAVLATAERLFADSDGRGLLVALYDGEENGLLGSRALRDDLARPDGLRIGTCGPVVHLHDVVAVVNLDASTARASDVVEPLERVLTDLGVPITVPLFSWRVLVFSEEPVVGAALVQTMTAAGVLGVPLPAEVATVVNGGITRTDGHWFHDVGIPVAWPVAGYPEYHTSADTIAAVDPVDLANLVTGATALVRALDDRPVGRLSGARLPTPGSSPASPRPAACTHGGGAAPGPGPQPAPSEDPAPGERLPETGGGPSPLIAAVVLGVAVGAVRAATRSAPTP
jgi:hypothetical protein